MLAELGVVEPCYRAVLEILDGSRSPMSLGAGVSRQTVHSWLRRHAADGRLANQADVAAAFVSAPDESPGRGEGGVYRALVRDARTDPVRRQRKPADYRRWERSRARQLWQMDDGGSACLMAAR